MPNIEKCPYEDSCEVDFSKLQIGTAWVVILPKGIKVNLFGTDCILYRTCTRRLKKKKKVTLTGPALEQEQLTTELRRAQKTFFAALNVKSQAEKDLKAFYRRHPELDPNKKTQCGFVDQLFGGVQ